jgi:7-dehydrocholesterol reductase
MVALQQIAGIFGIFIFSAVSIPLMLGEISGTYYPVITAEAVKFILGFSLFQILLMKYVPGDKYEGPLTDKLVRPMYVDNGFRCFVLTMITYFLLVVSGFVSGSYLIGIYPNVIITLNVYGLIVATLLYFKGKYYPNCLSREITGSLVRDFYVGTELYPKVWDLQVKVFTNCRFGMTLWSILMVSCMAYQFDKLGYVSGGMIASSIVMGTYLIKFFWWETGYYQTLDIAHDKCGYYLCYGCIAFLPLFYISPVYYQVFYPTDLHEGILVLITLMGLASVYFNYQVDKQKQVFKDYVSEHSTEKNKILARFNIMTVQDSHGTNRELLVGGWWGVARKINYTFELLLTLCWSAPAGFNSIIPFAYFIYLTILLVHRIYRDEDRCSGKYGEGWDRYKKRVPYIMIPYIY